MTHDTLRTQWHTRSENVPLHAEMIFEGGALVLGAGTTLIKSAPDRRGNGAPDDTSPDDARLLALLSAAHRRPITQRALAHIQRAVVKRGEGQTVLALIPLALSGVAKLEQPVESIRRLFVADELMKAGVMPSVVANVFARFIGSLG